MTVPLDSLDQVDWDRLVHAYGPAGDVPGHIRALQSDDETARKHAINGLHATICHQGSRYRASAPAVPLLLELLRAPETKGKPALMELLTGLAVGYAEWHVPLGFVPDNQFRDAESLLTSIDPDELLATDPAEEDDWDEARLSVWKVLAYRAVLGGIEAIRDHVSHLDEAVRIAAVKALAWFPDAAADSATLVRGQFEKELPALELANAILCLGILDRYLGDAADADLFRVSLGPEQPWVVRVAAAISLGVVLGPDAPEAALEILLEAVQRPDETSAAGAPIPWHWLGLVGHCAQAIRQIRPPATEPVLSALCRASEKVADPMAGAEVIEALLSVVFPEIDQNPPPRDPKTGFRRLDPTQLTGEQLLALRAIGRAPVWDVQPFFYGQLMDVGLQYGFSWDPKRFRELLQAAERAYRDGASTVARVGDEGG